ncbi:hypothetical protein B0J18DRAFT_418633, partial [Chaetomium sp. MPI-SDFR-AT-0129]
MPTTESDRKRPGPAGRRCWCESNSRIAAVQSSYFPIEHAECPRAANFSVNVDFGGKLEIGPEKRTAELPLCFPPTPRPACIFLIFSVAVRPCLRVSSAARSTCFVLAPASSDAKAVPLSDRAWPGKKDSRGPLLGGPRPGTPGESRCPGAPTFRQGAGIIAQPLLSQCISVFGPWFVDRKIAQPVLGKRSEKDGGLPFRAGDLSSGCERWESFRLRLFASSTGKIRFGLFLGIDLTLRRSLGGRPSSSSEPAIR